jgi:hypothetical protein
MLTSRAQGVGHRAPHTGVGNRVPQTRGEGAAAAAPRKQGARRGQLGSPQTGQTNEGPQSSSMRCCASMFSWSGGPSCMHLKVGLTESEGGGTKTPAVGIKPAHSHGRWTRRGGAQTQYCVVCVWGGPGLRHGHTKRARAAAMASARGWAAALHLLPALPTHPGANATRAGPSVRAGGADGVGSPGTQGSPPRR